MPEDASSARLEDVFAEIEAPGTYTHTTDELTVGAKLAWHNHTRCIGKLYWRWLAVRDCRHVTAAEDIRDECFEHLRVVPTAAASSRRSRSSPPTGRGSPRRACTTPSSSPTPATARRRHRRRRRRDGRPHGARPALGWTPGGTTPFDLLPIVLETPDGEVSSHPVPPELA